MLNCAVESLRADVMRRVNYEEWKKSRRVVFDRLLEVENRFQGRAAGRRPRDPEKERILVEMDRARRDRLIESGKLEIVEPRRWKWRVNLPESGR